MTQHETTLEGKAAQVGEAVSAASAPATLAEPEAAPGKPTTSAAPAPAKDPRLAQLHRVMLMMLKDFSAICEREGLSWVAMYGTAIGALRHKGFIPWDDDIDICMPRSDLDQLIAVVEADSSGKYRMIDSRLNPNYPMATARMMLVGTEFRDSALATMDFESGIFLDLFPLDAVPDDEAAYRKQAWGAWFNNKLAIAKLVRAPYIAGGGMRAAVLRAGSTGMRALLHLPGLSRVDFNARSFAHQTACAGQDTERVAFLCETDRFSCTYRRDELFPVRMVPFEDMQVPIANKAEKLLFDLYGDYMTPPPEDMRHEHYPDVLDFGPYAGL